MKKTYKMFLAMMLCMLCGVNVSAETISLEEVPFWQHEVWGLDEPKNTRAECIWVIGESTGQPYGDSGVNNFADLSNYNKLVVTVTDGTPRFLLNRDADGGQWNADESQSHLIEYPKNGWEAKYFSSAPGENEGETVYTVDLKQIVKDKGYAYLNAIKGANWGNVTVVSMVVVSTAKVPVGWTSVINNGDLEGEDVSSFFFAEDAVNDPSYQEAYITDGVGVNESRALSITSLEGATQTWATQLFVAANEALPEGTQWRFSMQVRADAPATVSTGAHAAPREYKAGGIIPEFNVDTDWSTVSAEGTVDSNLGAAGFRSIAFDLNVNQNESNTFYFDNFKFEVFKLGTVAEFSNDVVLVDFGFETNIPELVSKCGKKRLMYPMDCVTVKVNGTAQELYSVEGFGDGRFYIFLQEAADEDAEVEVSFKNPTDPAYQVIYASGAVNGQVVKDFEGLAASNNAEIEDNDGYPYDYMNPTLMQSDPEDGSFNLPSTISEFKLYFDKEVDCAALEATLNGQALTVVPADGFASDIVLTREATALPTSEYTLHLTKVYPKLRLADEYFADTTLVLNIGKVENDPNDVVRELIPAEYFGNCNANSIPEGFFVLFGTEERPSGSGAGSGSRMFNFAEGGDFTKGLYFREGYVEYGTTAATEEKDYSLDLVAGSKYEISFNTAMWKSNGDKTSFRIFKKDDIDAAAASGEDPVAEYAVVVNNSPDMNGSTGAVNGSTRTTIKFVPETTGKYVLRWVSSGSETGAPEYKEILLANPSMKYIPNKAGIEWIQLLENALETAKAARTSNDSERYYGVDFSTLDAAIQKYEVEKEGYTNPSAYQNAADDLTALTQALKDHHALCDDYDSNIKKTIDVERQNREKKFNVTELYAQVVAMNAKYNGTSEWVNVAEIPEGVDESEVEPVWQLNYSFDMLTDNDQLKEAIAELKDLANTTSLLFTEGVSAPENANGGKATGVAVAFERIRRGLETLKALGVEETDGLYEYANNALTDDDEIAEAIKNRIKLLIYKAPQQAFETVVNEETFEETTPSYEMTVFVKNPNIYKTQPNMDFTEENVPGWVTPEGYDKPGLTVGWGAPKHVEGVYEDIMFQRYMGPYRVEQTITDLPAGVFTIYYGFSERSAQGDDLAAQGSYAYAKTSDTPEGEEGLTEEITYIGQAFPFAEGSGSLMIENVVVTDGMLTIGVNAGEGANTFFNDVHIWMMSPADGFNYQAAYEELAQGVESVEAATVRGVELYDLNGRRLVVAPRGIAIVKKYMSDGTVRMEKVIKK